MSITFFLTSESENKPVVSQAKQDKLQVSGAIKEGGGACAPFEPPWICPSMGTANNNISIVCLIFV